jgi:hypothetical protein
MVEVRRLTPNYGMQLRSRLAARKLWRCGACGYRERERPPYAVPGLRRAIAYRIRDVRTRRRERRRPLVPSHRIDSGVARLKCYGGSGVMLTKASYRPKWWSSGRHNLLPCEH